MLKFSFLVALYNGEQYLSKMLDSLLNQNISYDEYEIICLDDCSPDGSAKIVKEYQRRYPNILLYKNERNCKIATNVNKLVSLSRGKYFWTIGQDDYIENNCLKQLWERLISEDLDVLVFNYRRVNGKGHLIENIHEVNDTNKMNGVDWIRNQYANRDYCCYILGYEWRAIYKTEYWRTKDIKCVDGLSWEDTVIMMKAIVFSKAVASSSAIFYNYRRNDGSISFCENHIKRGDYIYEFSFPVGNEVEQFYNQLKVIAPDLAENMLRQLKWRYNCFAFDLIRTSREQRLIFYEICKLNNKLVQQKWHWLKYQSKILLYPIIGYNVANMCNVIYKIKKFFR